MSKLLVVDDEQSICWGLSRLGESMGHEVAAVSSAEQGFAEARRLTPDVIILDVRLPGMDGLAAIERFQHQLGSVPIIVITAYGDLQTAVDAVRRGAFDYIAKPFDVEKVKRALVRALVSRDAATPFPAAPTQVEGTVGRSAAMQEVYKQIALAAASDAAVLIGGESGTGKELAARAIHRYSRRSGGPFVAVHAGYLGARDGEFAELMIQANGGTLFLDEVAEIPLPAQVELLRALEHREVVPSGGQPPVPTNVRVISTSNRRLSECVARGQLRNDLLMRLRAFEIDLPALRDRPDDIVELVRYFVALLSQGGSESGVRVNADALAELKRRPWHGNVRELRAAIEHALVVARGRTILPEHLPPIAAAAATAEASGDVENDVTSAVERWAVEHLGDAALAGQVYEKLLEVIEPPLLAEALKRHRGQCAAAARTLGIHRTTLRKKLIQHELENSDE